MFLVALFFFLDTICALDSKRRRPPQLSQGWCRGRDHGKWLCCVLGCWEQGSLLLLLHLQTAKQQKLSRGTGRALSEPCLRYGLTHTGNASPKSGVLQVIFHERRLANIYRLCLGKGEITGNYRSTNWSTVKGEFLEQVRQQNQMQHGFNTDHGKWAQYLPWV